MHQDTIIGIYQIPTLYNLDWLTKRQKNGAVEYLWVHIKIIFTCSIICTWKSQKVKEIVKLKNKFKTKSFNLNSGDCLIHHSQIIHGSKKNSSKNSRKGFTVQVMTTTSKLNKEKFRKYQESLKKQIELRST